QQPLSRSPGRGGAAARLAVDLRGGLPLSAAGRWTGGGARRARGADVGTGDDLHQVSHREGRQTRAVEGRRDRGRARSATPRSLEREPDSSGAGGTTAARARSVQSAAARAGAPGRGGRLHETDERRQLWGGCAGRLYGVRSRPHPGGVTRLHSERRRSLLRWRGVSAGVSGPARAGVRPPLRGTPVRGVRAAAPSPAARRDEGGAVIARRRRPRYPRPASPTGRARTVTGTG